MFENVAWNTSALVVKGDNHNVSYNTVFDGSDIPEGLPMHDRPRYQDANSVLGNVSIASIFLDKTSAKWNPKANAHTVFEYNLLDNMTVRGKGCEKFQHFKHAHHCFLPGKLHDNLVLTNTTFDIRRELRDPYHLDFRPCPNSQVATVDAGAYRVHDNEGLTYWIPGRQLYTAVGTPIPPNDSISVKTDADLMFLPMRGASVAPRLPWARQHFDETGRDARGRFKCGTQHECVGERYDVRLAGRRRECWGHHGPRSTLDVQNGQREVVSSLARIANTKRKRWCSIVCAPSVIFD